MNNTMTQTIQEAFKPTSEICDEIDKHIDQQREKESLLSFRRHRNRQRFLKHCETCDMCRFRYQELEIELEELKQLNEE